MNLLRISWIAILSAIFLLCCKKDNPVVVGNDPILTPDYWNAYLGGLERRGISRKVGAREGIVAWKTAAPAIQEMITAPVVDKNGVIYVVSQWFPSKLFAIEPDGTVRWSYTLKAFSTWNPHVTESGTIYVGDNNGYFYAIHSGGDTLWTFKADKSLSDPGSVAIDANGNIYFCSSSAQKLYSLASNGTLRWKLDLPGLAGSPALSQQGILYVLGHSLSAVNSAGEVIWNTYIDSLYAGGSPVIAPDGSIVIYSRWKIMKYTSQGTRLWERSTGISAGATLCAPAVDDEGSIYFLVFDQLVKLDKDGTEVWRFNCLRHNPILSSPTIDRDGTIYFGIEMGSIKNPNFYALKKDGTVLFSLNVRNNSNTFGDISSPPAIIDSAVVISLEAGGIAKIR